MQWVFWYFFYQFHYSYLALAICRLAKRTALIFLATGDLGLLNTTILKGKGTQIDYLIFALDFALAFAIFALVLTNYSF